MLEAAHQRIKPQPGEWKFMEITWAANLAEARQRAAKDGKDLPKEPVAMTSVTIHREEG